jgi:hypothetical protein
MGSLSDRLRPYFQTRPRTPRAAAPTRGRAPARAGAPRAGAQVAPQPQQPMIGNAELAHRREELAVELAGLTWDLGGLTYEMAIRDHFRLDVLVRQAARLQRVDAELGSIDRLLRLEQAGAAGDCPACGALYARGAVYCGQCGKDLVDRVTLAPPAAPGPGPGAAAPSPAEPEAAPAAPPPPEAPGPPSGPSASSPTASTASSTV